MRAKHLIIDGSSLLHRDPGIAPLLQQDRSRARLELIRKLARLAPGLADRTTLVFDGRGTARADRDLSITALEVLYSGSSVTADTIIERLVHEAPDPGGILVVASDRAELETVAAAGAQTMACGSFLDHLTGSERDAARIQRRRRKLFDGSRLGDFFPDP